MDVGTNSIGWVLLSLNDKGSPVGIFKIGVRIFSDGRRPDKDKASLAVARRMARQMRRQRDRKNQRKKLIINSLVKMGLFPIDASARESLKKVNVLSLRSLAVQEGNKLTPYELGRIILHLSKSRGFKSSRKETSEKRDTKISGAIDALKTQLSENQALSFGDFLFKRTLKGLSTVATIESGFYPSRDLVTHEFDEILRIQRVYHPNIPDSDWQRLRDKVIFYQRPLRPVEVGKCSLFNDMDRGFQFLPSYELYRLLGELHNLRWRDSHFQEQAINTSVIQKCIDELQWKPKIKYSDIRKVAGIDKDVRFTIETKASRQEIKGCPTICFMGDSKKGVLKGKWISLSLADRDAIANAYFLADSAEELRNTLSALDFLSEEEKQILIDSEIPGFSDSTCAFSKEALQKIVELCLADSESPLLVLSKLRREEQVAGLSEKLEYYGKAIPDTVVPIPSFIARNNKCINEDERQYGKIANPTVHIGMNQIRVVVNELIGNYGKPDEVHIEFARDLKLSRDQKINIAKTNKINKAVNERAHSFIEEHGIKVTPFNMQKVKLWFEMENRLDCHCIYTGKKISQSMVLSEKVEIDHILPFSRTLDDGFMNKVLVLVEANRIKGAKTPFEAFARDEEQWLGILERAKRLPESKAWRFSKNAMETFLKNNDFLARQLTDTTYLSKSTKKYLRTVIPENKIVTSPGRLTALIRGKLGMNQILGESAEKNRNDHRHHAVDAIVIGITDRSLLQQISKASENERQRVIVEPPWPGFHEATKIAMEKIVVSHRVDHGENAAFVEQTGFGMREPKTDGQIKNNYKLVTRKPIDSVNDFDKIVGDEIRELAVSGGIEALKAKGVKRLRVYDVCKEKYEDIGSKNSYIVKVQHGELNQHYVCYKKDGTYKMCIWRVPNAKDSKPARKGEKFSLVVTYIYYFDAPKYRTDPNQMKPHPAAKLLMTLHNGDTVALEKDGKLGYYQVKSLKRVSTQTKFLAINFQSEPEGEKEFLLAASKLKGVKLRKIRVMPDGRVFDGGPRL